LIHFDEMACLLYLEGQLDAARSRELSAHVEECAACRDLLNALKRETNLLSSALTEDDEPFPARLITEEAPGFPSWVWTLAFGIFTAGAYWLWIDGVGPWVEQLSSAGFGGTDLFSMIIFSGAFWEGWSDMFDTIQVGALLLAAIVAIAWIRRRLRRTVVVAAVMSGLALLAATPQSASAAEVRRGKSISVPVGEILHNDLVATGSSVKIEGTVDGDVIAFTRELSVTGHVTGDVIAFSQEAVIDGTVDGNVRVFSRGVMLQGTVGKNVTAFGSSVDSISKSSVGGGMIVLAGEADLDGKMQRDLLGLIGTTDLDSAIGGQLWIRGGNLTVGSAADIHGAATFVGPQQPTVQAGAKLASPIQTEITQEVRRKRRTGARVVMRAIFGYAVAVAVGALLLMVFPGFFRGALREAGTIFVPIGVGALALGTGLFLLIIGALLLFVGVGAGIAAVFAYAPVLYVSQLIIGAWLGGKMMGDGAPVPSAAIARIAAGLLVLRIVELIPVLGWFVGAAVIVWGTGAILMGFYRIARTDSAPATLLPA
jgi:anti-sigma factor RsiW